MTKFFVPFADDADEAERVYDAIRKFVSAPPDGPRIFGLSWVHNSQRMQCKVGDPLPAYYQTGDEAVLAIFDYGDHYAICTPSRGGIKGGPVLAGKNHQSNATYFDRE